MRATYDNQKAKWRILIPPIQSETGKRQVRFFDTKKEAEAEAENIQRSSSDPATDISQQDIHLLELIKKHYGENPLQAFADLKAGQKQNSVEIKADLETVCLAFVARQEHEGRNIRTIYSDRQVLRKLVEALGPQTPMVEVTTSKVLGYINAMPPGTTRQSHFARIRKAIVWAWREGYLATNLFDKVKSKDKWGSNTERVEIEHYRRILFCLAGLEPLKPEEAPTFRYSRLLPWYVLGGMAGMRRCELIDSDGGSPVIEWSDILWDENLIYVRHEVAKQTRKEQRRRYIPLTSQAKAWLSLVRQDRGRILDMSQSTLQRLNEAFLDAINDKVPKAKQVVVPDNGLRNSYASYRRSFDSPGDVARAMGDLEGTIERFYVGEALKPETGRAWFAIAPGERKIIAMGKAA